MKKLGMLIVIWLLAQGVTLPALAACPDAPFDGYLVRMAEHAPVPLSDELEYVTPGVYWLEDAALAEDFVTYGVAEYAEPNYQVELFETEDNMPIKAWAYTAVGAEAAAEKGLSGAGVRIAVIDSGVDLGNLNLENAVIAAGYDYVTSSTGMTDTVGHGTYVTQMIAGDGDEGMMQGIAPQATIVPLRCFDGRTTDIRKLLQAIEEAADPEKFDCDIINMSWGDANNSQLMAEALQKAYDAGVHLVAAAGNVQTGMPQGTVFYPAALDTVIGVGSVTEGKTVATTSQQTAAVDVCAPGHGITACSLYNVQATINGTSFATPCVSATLALILEAAPDMTPAFAAELLYVNSEDLGAEGRDDAYGHGFVDVAVLFSKAAWTVDFRRDDGLNCWLPDTQRRKVCAAVYRADGKLMSLQTMELVSNQYWCTHRGIVTDPSDVIKVFVVADDWRPCRAEFLPVKTE